MIELVEISSSKKLNYLINVYKLILEDNNTFNKKKIDNLYNYLKFSYYLHKRVNQRLKLIFNHYKNLNKKAYMYHFYDNNLYESINLEIIIHYQFHKYYKNIIFQNWKEFDHIINYFISKYIY